MLITSCLEPRLLFLAVLFPALAFLHFYCISLYLPADFIQIPLPQRNVVLLASRCLPFPLHPPPFHPVLSSPLHCKGIVTIIWLLQKLDMLSRVCYYIALNISHFSVS